AYEPKELFKFISSAYCMYFLNHLHMLFVMLHLPEQLTYNLLSLLNHQILENEAMIPMEFVPAVAPTLSCRTQQIMQ
ncbi:unnamed protein product, partial [Ceratitis capitata]